MPVSDYKKILNCFEERRFLSSNDWNHRAHLIVAMWYVFHYPGSPWHAVCMLKPKIIHNNISLGVENTEVVGYHETRTCFWVIELHNFYKEHSRLTFEHVLEKLLANEKFLDQKYIEVFYSKKVLNSVRARACYIPPDKP